MTWDDEDATVVRKAQDREHLKALVESSHYRAVFGAKEQQ